MSKNKTVRNVFFAVFCLFACISLGRAESCSSSGQVQYKYTASGCNYITEKRTCCSNGSWSAWNGSCPTYIACNSGNKPVTTQACGGGTGSQTRTVSCDTSTGKWITGSWGTCTCPSGSFWDSYYSSCASACYCGWGYKPACPYDKCKNLCCPSASYDMDNAICGGVSLNNYECTGGLVLSYASL